MQHNHGEWAGGLMGFENNCAFCLMACVCPAIAYGLNFSAATTNDECDCIMPALAHVIVDSVATPILCCGYHTLTVLPFACCLRYTHRRTAVTLANSTETKLDSLLAETFCWGCSQAQVARQAMRHLEGNRFIGTLNAHSVPIPTAVPMAAPVAANGMSSFK